MPITIISPGVEVIENDMSLRAVVPTGTSVTVPIFANQGPTGEVITISTISEFEDIFGLPTNSAELYGHATVSQVVNSAAKVSVIRIPYGDGSGDTTSPSFTVLAYPAKGFAITQGGTEEAPTYDYEAISKYSDGSAIEECKDSATFLIGEPVQFTMSIQEYYNFIAGRTLDGAGSFTWDENIPSAVPATIADIGKFAFLAINVDKTVTNQGYEGFYLGLSDNAFSDPEEEYTSIKALKTVTSLPAAASGITGDSYLSVPESRLDFKLSGDQKGCISQVMQEAINSVEISGSQWNDTLNVGIFKIRQSLNSGDALKLSAIMTKSYNAAIEADRKTTSPNTVTTVDSYIEHVSADKGTLNIFVNPYLSGEIQSRGLYADGSPRVKVRMYTERLSTAATDVTADTTLSGLMASPVGISSTAISTVADDDTFNTSDALYPIGLYSAVDSTSKKIGAVPNKIEDALAIIANSELYDLDLILEGGMGTIYVGAQDNNGIFDDAKRVTGVDAMRTSKALNNAAETIVTNYKSVINSFLKIATSQADGGRGDTFFIADGLRHISIDGRDTKIEKLYKLPISGGAADAVHTFSTSIYWPLRHLYNGIASSYMAVYPHFLKMQNPTNSTQFWAPASGAVAAKIAATDNKVGPWQAAAGLTNGVLSGVLDISFNTTQRQRDDLYKISLNPIINTPEATQIYGIRTMIRVASSFDQITVRRLFLYINKLLRNTAKQFLFEGNTDYTRLRVVETLKPVFDDLLTKRALYNYMLVCDSRNNTAQVVDDGILQIDFYGSGTRTAERIAIGVTATRYGTDLTELVG